MNRRTLCLFLLALTGCGSAQEIPSLYSAWPLRKRSGGFTGTTTTITGGETLTLEPRRGVWKHADGSEERFEYTLSTVQDQQLLTRLDGTGIRYWLTQSTDQRQLTLTDAYVGDGYTYSFDRP
ncbi:hypothetical protein [Armatimonas rosea]|uniref:Lipocalin-like domain-containing protein n=1 Tax=Armatimonas rosea TaxID=685828 RepID=A0A7W9W4R0_ARMRO|nr:hypothetical protein [Armatimonas rosea]MBB6048241.1 hypothetical protein [Armatimonas rosea]